MRTGNTTKQAIIYHDASVGPGSLEDWERGTLEERSLLGTVECLAVNLKVVFACGFLYESCKFGTGVTRFKTEFMKYTVFITKLK